jgi:glycine/D-amino acid oxidase-like deaminating enzyme
MSSEPRDTVILGAGIIGLCTAYYLSQSGHTKPESIHLVDSSERLLHCASGFAGGFLAADCTSINVLAHILASIVTLMDDG